MISTLWRWKKKTVASWRAKLDMALESAMRLSEMMTLEWRQVDFGQRTIFLEHTKTTRRGKSGRRQIPMTSVLFEKLREWKEVTGASGWVFLALIGFFRSF